MYENENYEKKLQNLFTNYNVKKKKKKKKKHGVYVLFV